MWFQLDFGLPDDSQLISRFSIVIIACTLLGMGLGRWLPAELSPFAIIAGMVGLLFYGWRLHQVRTARTLQAEALREHAQQRLVEMFDSY